jgi:hypothetical protein
MKEHDGQVGPGMVNPSGSFERRPMQRSNRIALTISILFVALSGSKLTQDWAKELLSLPEYATRELSAPSSGHSSLACFGSDFR